MCFSTPEVANFGVVAKKICIYTPPLPVEPKHILENVQGKVPEMLCESLPNRFLFHNLHSSLYRWQQQNHNRHCRLGKNINSIINNRV